MIVTVIIFGLMFLLLHLLRPKPPVIEKLGDFDLQESSPVPLDSLPADRFTYQDKTNPYRAPDR